MAFHGEATPSRYNCPPQSLPTNRLRVAECVHGSDLGERRFPFGATPFRGSVATFSFGAPDCRQRGVYSNREVIMPDKDRDPVETLERFRSYLSLLARLQMAPQFQGKFDASDVVQQTMARAVEAIDQFRGDTEAELAAWLRQILSRQLINAARDLGRDKRDVARERSLEAAVDESSARLEAWLAAEQSSPSQRAERNEQVLHLAEALAGLPEAQREALTLHHLQGWTLAQVGGHLGRSETAAAGLIKRGLKALRRQLQGQ